METLTGEDLIRLTHFETAYKLLQEYGTYERHFNVMQTVYRNLASTWLLGSLIASGYALAQKLIGDEWSIILFIGVLGAAGLGLLWALDIYVYHGLLRRVYDAGKHVEKTLPAQLRFRSHDGGFVRLMICAYYLAGYGIEVMIAVLAWHQRWVGLGSTGKPRWDLVQVIGGLSIVVLAALPAVVRKVMNRRGKHHGTDNTNQEGSPGVIKPAA